MCFHLPKDCIVGISSMMLVVLSFLTPIIIFFCFLPMISVPYSVQMLRSLKSISLHMGGPNIHNLPGIHCLRMVLLSWYLMMMFSFRWVNHEIRYSVIPFLLPKSYHFFTLFLTRISLIFLCLYLYQ